MATAFVRTVLLYFILIAGIRALGKRQIGELEPIELVMALLISDLAAVPMQDFGIPLVNGVVPILTLLSLSMLLSCLSMRSIRFHRLICGSPTMLIRNGEIQQRALRRNRFTLDELLEELRANSFHNASDVEAALLETNGKLSIIPKSSARTVTTDDLNIKMPRRDGLPYSIASDGSFNKKELGRAGLTKTEAAELLRKNGVTDIKTVL